MNPRRPSNGVRPVYLMRIGAPDAEKPVTPVHDETYADGTR